MSDNAGTQEEGSPAIQPPSPEAQERWRFLSAVPFRLTMSLTPPLCHMLRDPLLQERYERYLERAIGLAQHEMERTPVPQLLLKPS